MSTLLDLLPTSLSRSFPTSASISAAISRIPTALGYSVIAYSLYRAGVFLAFHLHRSQLQRYRHGPRNQNSTSKDPAAWALVTGASAGIGLQFVHDFAESGFNVVLHGRNTEKLAKIVEGLRPKYPRVEFKTLIMDAAVVVTQDFDEQVLACVRGLNLTVVIHNVGRAPAGSHELAWQDEMTGREVDGWLDLNTRFMVQLTRVLLPVVRDCQPACMLYVSSGASMAPTPGMGIYAGCKAFMNQYATALDIEMRTRGWDIEIKSIVPGTVVVESNGTSEKDRSLTNPMPSEFVGSSLDKLGWGDSVIFPWWGHHLQMTFLQFLPKWVFEKIIQGLIKDIEAKLDKVHAERGDFVKKAQ